MLASSPTYVAALRDLARSGPVRLAVKGDCMEPLLADGDEVLVSRRRWLWPGDVVAFRSAEGPILVHRVLGLLPTGRGLLLFAQGDARSRPDTPVPSSDVIGTVRGGRRHATIAWRDRAFATRRFARHLGRLLLRRWPSQSAS